MDRSSFQNIQCTCGKQGCNLVVTLNSHSTALGDSYVVGILHNSDEPRYVPVEITWQDLMCSNYSERVVTKIQQTIYDLLGQTQHSNEWMVAP
jgi:hypothetical protein